MNLKNLKVVFAAAATFGLVACGGGSGATTRTATVGTAGATLTTDNATLVIPAGALTADTPVTVKEVAPKSGGDVRIEIEPAGHALSKSATLVVEDKKTTNVASVSMRDDSGTEHNTEVEDRNHHQFKTSMDTLGHIEMHATQGATCATACSATQECDDGTCKDHNGSAATCSTPCASGEECDDGACKTHGAFENEHGGAAGGTATCSPACDTAAGMECDATDLVCKPHGKP